MRYICASCTWAIVRPLGNGSGRFAVSCLITYIHVHTYLGRYMCHIYTYIPYIRSTYPNLDIYSKGFWVFGCRSILALNLFHPKALTFMYVHTGGMCVGTYVCMYTSSQLPTTSSHPQSSSNRPGHGRPGLVAASAILASCHGRAGCNGRGIRAFQSSSPVGRVCT